MCLFVVLGGTAFAAATVITGKNVKDGSLTGRDVKNSSLTGGDVKDKSLTPSDFIGSVTGPQGPKGDTGAQGPKGDPGEPGSPSFAFSSFGGSGSLATQAVAVADMELDPGEYVLHGNAIFTTSASDSVKVHCALGIAGTDGNEGSANAVDAAAVQLAGQGAIPSETTLALTGVVGFETPTTVSLECYPEGAGNATYRDADIGAIEASLAVP